MTKCKINGTVQFFLLKNSHLSPWWPKLRPAQMKIELTTNGSKHNKHNKLAREKSFSGLACCADLCILSVYTPCILLVYSPYRACCRSLYTLYIKSLYTLCILACCRSLCQTCAEALLDPAHCCIAHFLCEISIFLVYVGKKDQWCTCVTVSKLRLNCLIIWWRYFIDS